MLHNKYRPTTFEDFNNPRLTNIMQNQYSNPKGCYIFLGSSSSGKTTMARIMSKEGYTLELDGANVGVEQINLIKEECKVLDSRRRYYIIDEVHLISYSAMQGLLKLLEETPKNVTFILCTTEVHKLPETIFSRALVIKFPPLTSQFIYERLEYVCIKEAIKANPNALNYIAEHCNNNLRKALNELELYKDNLDDFVTEFVISDELIEVVIEALCIDGEIDYLKQENYNPVDLVQALLTFLVKNDENLSPNYNIILEHILELQWRLRTSPIPRIEMLATLYNIQREIRKCS